MRASYLEKNQRFPFNFCGMEVELYLRFKLGADP